MARKGDFFESRLGSRSEGAGGFRREGAAEEGAGFVRQIGTFVPAGAMVLERVVSHTRRKAHDSRKITETE